MIDRNENRNRVIGSKYHTAQSLSRPVRKLEQETMKSSWSRRRHMWLRHSDAVIILLCHTLILCWGICEMKSNRLLFKKNYEVFKQSIWKNKEKASNIWNNWAENLSVETQLFKSTQDQRMFFQLNCADPEVPSNIRNTFIYSVHLNVFREHTT